MVEGPSAVEPPAATLPASSLPAAFDAATVARLTALDPEYVHQLVYRAANEGTEHPLERWAPGSSIHYCAGPGVPLDVVDEVAAFVARETGLSRTDAGPCTVEWVIDGSIYGAGYTEKRAAGGWLVGARLVFHNEGSLRFCAGHEMLHAVGLGHSLRLSDLMAAHDGPGGINASEDELAVLRLVYGG